MIPRVKCWRVKDPVTGRVLGHVHAPSKVLARLEVRHGTYVLAPAPKSRHWHGCERTREGGTR